MKITLTKKTEDNNIIYIVETLSFNAPVTHAIIHQDGMNDEEHGKKAINIYETIKSKIKAEMEATFTIIREEEI